MARTALTPIVPVNINAAIVAGSAAITWTAADTVNLNSVVLTGREVVLIQNTSASVVGTVTISSVPDQLGRSADITAYSMPVSSFAMFGPIPLNGWQQATTPRTLNLQASVSTISFAVISLPASY